MRKTLCLLAVFTLLCARAGAEETGMLRLYVCPLRRADAMVLVQGSHAALIDAGEAQDAPAIAALLDSLQVTALDFALNTHPHHDHLGGLSGVLQQCGAACFLTGFPEDITGRGVVQKQAMEALGDAGVSVQRVFDGDRLALGDALITVLQCPLGTVNDRSVVLKMEYGACSLLLTGDISPRAQRSLAQRASLRADVLKVPHHGRDDMSSAFLTAVRPAMAVITNARRGTAKVRRQLDRKGIPFVLAGEGTACLSCDGQGWAVETLPGP